MCSRVQCGKCGRPSFAGCGAHVEQVLGDVPPPDRCRCREEKVKSRGADAPATAKAWFQSLLGK